MTLKRYVERWFLNKSDDRANTYGIYRTEDVWNYIQLYTMFVMAREYFSFLHRLKYFLDSFAYSKFIHLAWNWFPKCLLSDYKPEFTVLLRQKDFNISTFDSEIYYFPYFNPWTHKKNWKRSFYNLNRENTPLREAHDPIVYCLPNCC